MPIKESAAAERSARLRMPSEGTWIGIGVLALLVYLNVAQSQQLFHTFAEVIGATMAFLVAAVGVHAFPLARNGFFLTLGSGYFWVGLFTLMHALSYPGVGVLAADVPYFGIRVWLVARLFEACVLLSAIGYVGRTRVSARFHVGYAVLASGLFFAAGQPWFPDVFVDGQGLTPFKIASEYVIIALFMGVLIAMKRLVGRVDARVIRRLSLAIGFMIFSELPFTLYQAIGDSMSVLGHMLNLVAHWFLFSAAVTTTLKEPFRILSAEANTYEAFPDATVVVDRRGRVRQANLAARRDAGVDNCIGASCHVLFHPLSVAQQDCPACRRIADNVPAELLEMEDRVTGRCYHIILSSVGEMGMIHVRRDISDLKRAEGALRGSELRYRALMTNATDAIFVVDRSGRIVDANRKAEELLGYTRPELLNLSIRDIHPSEEAARVEKAFHDMRVHGSSLCEHKVRHKDGSITLAEVAGTQIAIEDNDVVYLGVFRDISARRKAEEALRENEALLREAEEVALMGSWDWCPATGNLRWSDGVYRVLGTERIEPSFQFVLDSMTSHDRERVKSLLMRATEKGEEFRVDYRLHRPDGQDRSVRMIGRVKRNSSRLPQRVFGTLMDITRARRIEEELQVYREDLERLVTERTAKLLQAIRELESFSYTVSHDLNAPLRAINGFSCALLDDCGAYLPDQGREYLDRIIHATNRMGHLIDGLLMLSRVIRREPQLQACNFSAMAEEVIAHLGARRGERHVEYAIDQGIVGEADPALLRLLFENLVGNAWKFTRERQSALIEFRAELRNEGNVYVVRDNGIGFDMQYAETLFRPFHRLHGWDEYEGMGIGLATVQRIVQQHGGRIWAESRPGEGAAFYFTLRPTGGIG